VFDGTNLGKVRHKACAARLGTLTEVEGKQDPRYTGLINPRASTFGNQEFDEGRE
jgi:hypothetical protein